MTDTTPAAGLDPSILAAETDRLLDFGQRFPHPAGGAYWLDNRGQPDIDRPVFTYITARMAHVYALGAGLGRSGAARLADEALRGLTGRLHDEEYGGWFTAIAPDGTIVDDKACYTQAFVVLAAASGSLAQRPGAPQLLQDSLAVWQDRFFEPSSGLFVDSWDRSFTTLDRYRGANANMHAVEALLAAADARGIGTADPALLEQALGISRRIVEFAEPHEWRIPEHFTSDWEPMLEHHRDQPDHPFQPYGATVGHGLEWSRLLLHLEAALVSSAPDWLLPAAIALFDRAAADGWCVDGRPGFVYTTDWDGVPVVRDRMHWVTAEGVAAAAALHRRTGEPRFAEHARTWWGFAEEYHIDRERGSWIHQLDAENRPADSVWPGKPDLYHAVQATLLPRHPLDRSLSAVLNS